MICFLNMDAYREALLHSLRDTQVIHKKLVVAGTDRQETGLQNAFGDIVMEIDYQCEEVVLNNFRVFAEAHNEGIEVISEEHGRFTIGSNPRYTLFIDGFDGSSRYRDTGGKSRGGPMVALYEGLNPCFSDYIVAGIVDLQTNEMLIATKDTGVALYKDGEVRQVGASRVRTLSEETRIYIDEGIQNFPTFPDHKKGYFYEPIKHGFSTQYLGSSAVYFFDVASGRADLDLEYGRKENLEHWTGYGLIKEAGGVFEFVSGGSVATTRYQDYLRLNYGHPAVIIAATSELADEVRNFSHIKISTNSNHK